MALRDWGAGGSARTSGHPDDKRRTARSSLIVLAFLCIVAVPSFSQTQELEYRYKNTHGAESPWGQPRGATCSATPGYTEHGPYYECGTPYIIGTKIVSFFWNARSQVCQMRITFPDWQPGSCRFVELNPIFEESRKPPNEITLSGPSQTKALPAGPVLPQVARVTRSGVGVPNATVNISIDGKAALTGTTDSAGAFMFTYVPPFYKRTTEQMSASCSGCSNTAQKSLVVEACDSCSER